MRRGHGGWRGYLYHLAVAQPCRDRGIGSSLVTRVTQQLTEAGMQQVHVFVTTCNQDGRMFWQALGWNERVDSVVRTANLSRLAAKP